MSKQTYLEIQDTKRIIKHELEVLKSISILKTRSEHRLAEYYEELADLEAKKPGYHAYVVKIDRDSIRTNPDKDGSMDFVPGSWTSDGKGGRSRSITPVYTMGGPEYLYDRIPCEVTCYECENTFSYKELGYDDEDEDEICPKCDTHNCCVVEFERLEDVLEEINE